LNIVTIDLSLVFVAAPLMGLARRSARGVSSVFEL
ncbi:hypothetical protein A2U01_0067982, partial [Trifolium medium]|nr:hypothetical protein [Trifolium medium]